MPVTNKRRLAVDETTIEDEAMEKAIEYLQSRLKPEELSHLKAMLKGEQPEAEAEDDDPEQNEREKLPKPSGKMIAADSRPNTYADRFPDVARIRVWL